MKYLTVTALVLVLSISLANAQETTTQRCIPAWVSEKGYWVVESNIKTPRQHIIFFYNQHNVLVYQETLKDVKLNLNRKKVKVKLSKALDEAVVVWENQHAFRQNESVVMNLLTK